MSERNAIVIGAGIGGLAVAAGLCRNGWRVTVLEQVPQLSAAGAGITLAPNAVRALDWLGAGAARVARLANTANPALALLRDLVAGVLPAAVFLRATDEAFGWRPPASSTAFRYPTAAESPPGTRF